MPQIASAPANKKGVNVTETRQSRPVGTASKPDIKTARKLRRCVAAASASKEQIALFETLWAEHLEAADSPHDLLLETWMARNCHTTSLNALNASGLLSLTVRLINATSKARLLQAGELFYNCSNGDQTDQSSL